MGVTGEDRRGGEKKRGEQRKLWKRKKRLCERPGLSQPPSLLPVSFCWTLVVLSGSSEYPKGHRGQLGKDPYIVILPTQHSWCNTTDLPQSGQESRSHRCCQKDCLLSYEPIKIKVSSGPRPFHFLPLLPSPEFCAVPHGYGCRVMVQPSLPSGPDLRTKEVIQGKYQVIQLQPSNSWPLPATASFKYLVVFEKKKKTWSLFLETGIQSLQCPEATPTLSRQKQGYFHCTNWGWEIEAFWKIP